MLYRLLSGNRDAHADRPAVAGPGPAATHRQLAERAEGLRAALSQSAGGSVGLALPAGPDWIAAAGALDALGCRTFLLPPLSDPSRTGEQAAAFKLDAVLHDRGDGLPPPFLKLPPHPDPLAAAPPAAVGQSSVVLLTSGTAGQPKAALHSWNSLAGGIHRSERLADARMLLAYEPSRFAGLQVLLTALVNAATLCIPRSRDVVAAAELIAAERVDFVSATPTFWRMLLANSTESQRRQMPLRQITLGGEPITQPVLDALRRAFPAAQITHIYASTEMGVCFSVHDGREGFPAAYLDSDSLPVRLRIQDGLLWIRSNRAMAGYLGGGVRDEWFNTGDAVQLAGGRVLFLGRDSTRINVGGEKVYPEQVEAVVRQADGVVEARVTGVASSIVGQLVQAEVVARPGADREQVRRAVAELCREKLPAYQRPRVIEFVDNLMAADTMKVPRGQAS